MKSKIEEFKKEIEGFNAKTSEELEAFRIKFLGSKGVMKSLFADFKNVAPSDKKEMGQLINNLKVKATEKLESLKTNISSNGGGGIFHEN